MNGMSFSNFEAYSDLSRKLLILKFASVLDIFKFYAVLHFQILKIEYLDLSRNL